MLLSYIHVKKSPTTSLLGSLKRGRGKMYMWQMWTEKYCYIFMSYDEYKMLSRMKNIQIIN